jgi:GT2 family glycosyltransferase
VKYRRDLKPVFYVEYDRATAEVGGIPEREKELEKHPPAQRMVIIQTGENLGFSGGNNVGAKYAFKRNFRYVLLLNNDTLIMDRDFLWKLLQPMLRVSEAGLVGPKTINFSGEFDGPYLKETFMGELFWMSVKNLMRKVLGCPSAYLDLKALSSPFPVEVYKVSGVALFLELSFFAQLGFLDERLWLSSEEAALAEAVRKSGKKVFFQPLTLLLHKKAASPRDQNWYAIKKNAIKQREFFLKEYKDYSGLKLGLIKLSNRLRLLLSKLQSQVRRY